MARFVEFDKTFGGPSRCVTPSEDDLLVAAKDLPSEVVEEWKKSGLCTYGNGLLHVTNPKQFEGILEQWLDPHPERARVFLRTAFADLYFWDDGHVHALDVHYGRVSQVTQNVELFFN